MKITKEAKNNFLEAIQKIDIARSEKNSQKKEAIKEEVLRLLKHSFSLGNFNAANEVAQQYDEYGLFGEDAKKAAKWYKLASEGGHVEANNNLAFCYETGIGVRKNLKKAEEYYLKAAKEGSMAAQFNMGVMLEGVDTIAAINWFKKSLRGGNTSAALHLAAIYSYDEAYKNLTAAKKYLEMSKDLNEEEMEEFIKLRKYIFGKRAANF